MDDLQDIFAEHQVPHAPILGVKEALSQPQAVARELVVETEHAALGTIPIVNRPIKFPGAPQPIPSAPPVLGQHTAEILEGILGLTQAQVEELRVSKVIG
mgnify:CR=1 FL=1